MTELNRTDQARQAGAAWMLDDYPDGTGSGQHGEFLPVDMLDAFMAGVRWADDHQAAAELPNPTPPRPPCVGHTHGPDGCTECSCPLTSSEQETSNQRALARSGHLVGLGPADVAG